PRVQFANPRSAISSGHDQTDGPQQTKVLRDRRAAGTKIGGNLADGAATAAQQAQDFAPSRIGDRPEHGLASFAPCGHHYSLPSGYQYRNRTVTNMSSHVANLPHSRGTDHGEEQEYCEDYQVNDALKHGSSAGAQRDHAGEQRQCQQDLVFRPQPELERLADHD